MHKFAFRIHSRLRRCSTARVSSTELFLVGPTKVKAPKSFLFTEGSIKVENNEHLIDFVFTFFKMKSILSAKYGEQN